MDDNNNETQDENIQEDHVEEENNTDNLDEKKDDKSDETDIKEEPKESEEEDEDDDTKKSDFTKEEIIELNCLFALKYKEKEIKDRLAELFKNNPKQAEKDSGKIGTPTELYQRMLEHYGEQINFSASAIGKDDKLSNDYKYADDKDQEHKIKDSYLVADSKEGITNVSGEKAVTMMFSVNRNIKRIKLMNSGFFIDIKSPLLSEINILYNSISDSSDEYGKMFGTFFYLYADLEIKKHLVDFFCNLVINSNLKGWSNKDALKKNISINDYPSILHSISCLMYKSGYIIKSICPSCDYTEEEQVDLNLLKYHNFSILPEFCLKIISSTDIITPATARKYKHELLLALINDMPEGKDNKFIFDVDDFSLELKVPSIYEHLKYGDDYNSKLTKMVYSEDVKQIIQYLKFNYCQMFVPWVSSITNYSNRETKQGIKTEDASVFPVILDAIQERIKSGEEFSEKILNFISKTSITHMCYPANPCPSCGKEPTNAKEGYVFFDAQKNFFIHCAMKLIQNS